MYTVSIFNTADSTQISNTVKVRKGQNDGDLNTLAWMVPSHSGRIGFAEINKCVPVITERGSGPEILRTGNALVLSRGPGNIERGWGPDMVTKIV